MEGIIIFFTLIACLGFVASLDLNYFMRTKLKNESINRLMKVCRFIQFCILLISLFWLYFITYYFFHNGSYPKVGITTVISQGIYFDWGGPILIFISVLQSLILFGIVEIIVLIFKDYLKDQKLNEKLINRLFIVSNLFIIKIFFKFLYTYIEKGKLDFNLDILITYALASAFMRIVALLITNHLKENLIEEDSEV